MLQCEPSLQLHMHEKSAAVHCTMQIQTQHTNNQTAQQPQALLWEAAPLLTLR